MSTSAPFSGNAIGIYRPESQCNRNQTRGIKMNVDSTRSVVYEENRLAVDQGARVMTASLKYAGTETADSDYGYWGGEWTMPFHFLYTGCLRRIASR